MNDVKRQWLPRAVIGGCMGVAAHVLLGYLLGCFNLFGPARFSGFHFPDCSLYRFFGLGRGWELAGIALSFALFALFGAEVGVATLPFADSGRELVARSLVHYAATAATACLWAGLNICSTPADYLAVLIPLTLVYLIVWLGRWVGWYTEVAAIREKLGLDPGPSALHWKETLPYAGFALLLCDVLPLPLRLFDAHDFPVLTGVLLPYLLLPVGCFASGLSLGRRHGFCPLYPIACGLFYLPTVFLLANSSAPFHCAVALIAALAGNLAGAARRKLKKGAAVHEKTDPDL